MYHSNSDNMSPGHEYCISMIYFLLRMNIQYYTLHEYEY